MSPTHILPPAGVHGLPPLRMSQEPRVVLPPLRDRVLPTGPSEGPEGAVRRTLPRTLQPLSLQPKRMPPVESEDWSDSSGKGKEGPVKKSKVVSESEGDTSDGAAPLRSPTRPMPTPFARPTTVSPIGATSLPGMPRTVSGRVPGVPRRAGDDPFATPSSPTAAAPGFPLRRPPPQFPTRPMSRPSLSTVTGAVTPPTQPLPSVKQDEPQTKEVEAGEK